MGSTAGDEAGGEFYRWVNGEPSAVDGFASKIENVKNEVVSGLPAIIAFDAIVFAVEPLAYFELSGWQASNAIRVRRV